MRLDLIIFLFSISICLSAQVPGAQDPIVKLDIKDFFEDLSVEEYRKIMAELITDGEDQMKGLFFREALNINDLVNLKGPFYDHSRPDMKYNLRHYENRLGIRHLFNTYTPSNRYLLKLSANTGYKLDSITGKSWDISSLGKWGDDPAFYGY